MTWLDFLSQNLIALIALLVSVVATVSAQRGITSRVNAVALRTVEGQTAKLEAEIAKLQQGLDRCIKERVSFKGEIMAVKNSLKLANIEVEELRENADPYPD